MVDTTKPIEQRANQDVLSLIQRVMRTGRMPSNLELEYAGVTRDEFERLLGEHFMSRSQTEPERPNIFGRLMQRVAEWSAGVDPTTGELKVGHPARYKINRPLSEEEVLRLMQDRGFSQSGR